MTHRERIQAALRFAEPDQLPCHETPWEQTLTAWRQQGLPPEADLADIVDAGGHDAVIISVYNEDCEVGSSFVDARSIVEEEFPDVKDVVVVITESPPIPNDNISFNPDVPADMRDALVAVLLDLASTDEGLDLLDSVYSWSGMEVVEDSFYDGFRQQLEAAGLNIEELAGG